MDERAAVAGPATPRMVAVVAMAENRIIGRANALPWRLPDDLRRFKAMTLGRPVLMGRRTFESLGKPLPGRLNLVLTRDAGWTAAGITVVRSVDDALAAAGGASEVMVIGGAEVYALCWPRIIRLELTEVHAAPEGDTELACFDPAEWRVTATERHAADARHEHDYSFKTLERVPGQVAPSASTACQQSAKEL